MTTGRINQISSDRFLHPRILCFIRERKALLREGIDPKCRALRILNYNFKIALSTTIFYVEWIYTAASSHKRSQFRDHARAQVEDSTPITPSAAKFTRRLVFEKNHTIERDDCVPSTRLSDAR